LSLRPGNRFGRSCSQPYISVISSRHILFTSLPAFVIFFLLLIYHSDHPSLPDSFTPHELRTHPLHRSFPRQTDFLLHVWAWTRIGYFRSTDGTFRLFSLFFSYRGSWEHCQRLHAAKSSSKITNKFVCWLYYCICCCVVALNFSGCISSLVFHFLFSWLSLPDWARSPDENLGNIRVGSTG